MSSVEKSNSSDLSNDANIIVLPANLIKSYGVKVVLTALLVLYEVMSILRGNLETSIIYNSILLLKSLYKNEKYFIILLVVLVVVLFILLIRAIYLIYKVYKPKIAKYDEELIAKKKDKNKKGKKNDKVNSSKVHKISV